MEKITIEAGTAKIKEIAKELGINFVGKKNVVLVDLINDKIDAKNAEQTNEQTFTQNDEPTQKETTNNDAKDQEVPQGWQTVETSLQGTQEPSESDMSEDITCHTPLSKLGLTVGQVVTISGVTVPAFQYMNGRKAVVEGKGYMDYVNVRLLHKKMGYPQGTVLRVKYANIDAGKEVTMLVV